MSGTWSRKLAKIAGYGFLLLVVLAAAGISFTIGWRPFLGPRSRALTDRRFDPTPQRLARGEYLVNNVVGCYACHSPFDRNDPPNMVGPKGSGQLFLDQGKMKVVARNITSDEATGIGRWSDDAIARVIREGVGPDGKTVFPAMPYAEFRYLSDEDLASVVAYLRTTPPIRNQLPESSVPFPVNRLINLAPQPVTQPIVAPDPGNRVQYGEYVLHIAGCADCHTTKSPTGEKVTGMYLAGGTTLEQHASANLTPDPSGISYYDEALFISLFRNGRVGARRIFGDMPWWAYKGMTDDDLKAIFAYLRTIPPVKHRVDNSEPPTLCKICGLKHGGGELN